MAVRVLYWYRRKNWINFRGWLRIHVFTEITVEASLETIHLKWGIFKKLQSFQKKSSPKIKGQNVVLTSFLENAPLVRKQNISKSNVNCLFTFFRYCYQSHHLWWSIRFTSYWTRIRNRDPTYSQSDRQESLRGRISNGGKSKRSRRLKKRLKERRKIGTRPPKSEHKFEAFVFLRPPPLWNDDHMKKKYRYRVTYVSFQMIFFKAFKYLGSFGIDVCLGWILGASAMSEFFLYILSTIQKKYFCLCFLEYNNFWSLTEKKCFLKFRA